MKYITRLGVTDWLELYKNMLPKGVVGNDVKITTNEDRGYVEVTFKEDWTDENGTDLLDSRYIFRDFEAPECVDYCCSNDILNMMKAGFFAYMMATFGKEYLEDFILTKTNVKITFPPYFHLEHVDDGKDG